MKTFKTILASLLAIALFTACEQERESSGRFEVNGLKDSYTFAADLSQQFSFEIVSDNVLWDINFVPEDQEWLTVSPLRSLGGYVTVTLAPTNNDSGAVRECTMTLSNELGYSKTVQVSQRAE